MRSERVLRACSRSVVRVRGAAAAATVASQANESPNENDQPTTPARCQRGQLGDSSPRPVRQQPDVWVEANNSPQGCAIIENFGGSDDVSQSSIVAKGHAVMMKDYLWQATDTIRIKRPGRLLKLRCLCSLCQTKAPLASSPNGIHTPAIRTALRITVAMPAVSRMESCQSCRE